MHQYDTLFGCVGRFVREDKNGYVYMPFKAKQFGVEYKEGAQFIDRHVSLLSIHTNDIPDDYVFCGFNNNMDFHYSSKYDETCVHDLPHRLQQRFMNIVDQVYFVSEMPSPAQWNSFCGIVVPEHCSILATVALHDLFTMDVLY